MMLTAYWLYEPSLWWYKTCVRCNIFVYGSDVIAPMVIFGCTDVICKPYCSDVVEHCVRHRCYHACFDCTDVICNLIAQMLLSIVSGTDVLMPVFFISHFWHKCRCALFVARMLLGQSSIISFSVAYNYKIKFYNCSITSQNKEISLWLMITKIMKNNIFGNFKAKHFPRQTRRSSHVWLRKLVNLRIKFSSVSERTFYIN